MPATCSRCGTTEDVEEGSIPAGWSMATESKRVELHCPSCLRANIRAIEGKLPEEWWEH